jgi:hypothetical protein
VGWQHHPPRHAAARAALGVQAAHATLGMAPPHMPPSSPRHANAKRARPRHRGEPSHATAVTPCPVHAAPRTRPMPPMRTRPPPHATSALPAHSAPSLPVSARPLERACCLGKTCQWPTSRLAPGGSPMPPARRCPSKGTRTPLPPCNECPPRALGPVSARRGALERACCLGKACQWPASRRTPGAHPCPPPDVAHRKAHGCPSPPCNECPPRALGPVPAHRGALKPSSEHVASERSQTHRRHAYIGPTKASLVAPVCWSGVASGRVAVRRVMPCRSEPDGV